VVVTADKRRRAANPIIRSRFSGAVVSNNASRPPFGSWCKSVDAALNLSRCHKLHAEYRRALAEAIRTHRIRIDRGRTASRARTTLWFHRGDRRKALTDSFFLRGLKVPEDDLIEAMNVADDALLRNPRARGIKDRCKAELNLLTRIEKAPMESRVRCELVWRILNEDSIEAIDETLKKKEAEVSPNFGDGSDQAAAV
jgi:hypothetical protein